MLPIQQTDRLARRHAAERAVQELTTDAVLTALSKLGYSVSIQGTKHLTVYTDSRVHTNANNQFSAHVFIDSEKLKFSFAYGNDVTAAVARPRILNTIRRALGVAS